jgi:hypothetical protein
MDFIVDVSDYVGLVPPLNGVLSLESRLGG